MKRAERLHALSEALRRSGPQGRTAVRLAQEFKVSVRTVKRDLAALESAGVPVWSRPGPGGGYGLAPGTTLRPVSLSSAQAVALLTAVTAASDAPYADLAAAGARKIVDVLDQPTRERAEQLAQRIWVDTGNSSSRATQSALEHAMTDQRVVRLRYRSSAGAISNREVEPMLFASAHGQWHLVAWCRLRDAVRWFTTAGIIRASVTRESCAGHAISEIGTPPPSAQSASAF